MPTLFKVPRAYPSPLALSVTVWGKLLAALGESLLRRWIWESLRQLKEPSLAEIGGQLPLFGQFGDEIRTRDEWNQDHYRAYYLRYSNAATRNAAKLRVLAAEFESRFGYGIDEARAA